MGATDQKHFSVRTMRGGVDIGGMKFGVEKQQGKNKKFSSQFCRVGSVNFWSAKF